MPPSAEPLLSNKHAALHELCNDVFSEYRKLDEGAVASESACDVHEVLSLWPRYYYSLLFMGVLPPDLKWNYSAHMVYNVYAFSLAPLMVSLAIPYAWYVSEWFGAPLGSLNCLMLTLHGGSPAVIWFLLRKYIRSKHFTNLLLPLLTRYGQQSDRVEKARSQILHHFVAVIVFVVIYVWFTYQKVGPLLWSTWTNEGSYGALKQVVVLCLCITFWARCWVPLALLHLFQTMAQLHLDVMHDWVDSQRGTEDIAVINRRMEVSVAWRRFTEREWANKFTWLLAVPLIETGLFVYSLGNSSSAATTSDWLEFFYVLFCARVAYMLLSSAGALTTAAATTRFTVLDQMINGEADFKGSPTQHNAFLEKLGSTRSGFHVFGFEMNAELVSRSAYVFGSVLAKVLFSHLAGLHDLYRMFFGTSGN